MIGILLSESLLRYVFIYLTRWLGQSVILDLRKRMYNHIVSLKLKYFDQTPIGTSTTRTINDIASINEIFSQGIITVIADILQLVAII